MNAPPRYNVEIAPVREVALRGSADLAFWTERLRGEDLVPADDGGRAQLLITAVDSRFLGLAFRELSISVFVGQTSDAGDPEAVYLVHAFNSRRSFAFVERTFYHTPYHHADVRVAARLPAGFEARQRGATLVRAEMSPASASSRPAVRCGEEGWEGPILIPSVSSKRPRVFFARLSGHTHTYPFTADDRIEIARSVQAPVFGWLLESAFAATTWSIRETATHARTKSIERAALQLSPAGLAG